MNADVHTLHESSFYKIVDFRCKCDICSITEPEYHTNFSISYVQSGSFVYKVFRRDLEAHSGRFLVSKPEFEHVVKHFDNCPDKCTILSFTREFYHHLSEEYGVTKNWFFNDNDIQSLLLNATPETEYIHAAITNEFRSDSHNKLLVDTLVFELVKKIFEHLDLNRYSTSIIKKDRYHLSTIENAKNYIHTNYRKNISLTDISENSFVSPFHFTRVFKSITGVTPYQYLLETRLVNANVLLKHTTLPVTQICFDSGFNNADHFATAFKKRYNIQPSAVRKGNIL